MTPELHTPRLLLRALVAADASDIARLVADPAAMPTGGWPPSLSGIADDGSIDPEQVARFVVGHAADADRDTRIWAVTLDGALVGIGGLFVAEQLDSAELGYWIGSGYWGRGFATEVAARLVEYARTDLRLGRVNGRAFAINPASGRVLTKAGLRYEGTLRRSHRKGDRLLDVDHYALVFDARSRVGVDAGPAPVAQDLGAYVGWVQIDCRDPDLLRSFWAEVLSLGNDNSPAPPAFRCLAPRTRDGIGVCFQRVPEPKTVKNRVHLDVVVADIAVATARIEQLGGHRRGERSDHDEHGWRWRTMFDPEGNEFCLVPLAADPGLVPTHKGSST